MNISIELTQEYAEIYQNRLALKYCNLSHNLAWNVGDSAAIVLTGRMMGQLCERLSLLDSQLSITKKVLPIAARNLFLAEQSKILHSAGAALIYSANYDSALRCLFESLEIRIRIKDEKQIASSLHNIGLAFYKLDNFDKALEYSLQSLALREKNNFTYEKRILLVNIALCYINKADSVNAKKYIEKAGQTNEDGSDSVYALNAAVAWGDYYRILIHNSAKSDSHYRRGYEIAAKIGNARLGFDCLYNLAIINFEANKVKAALSFLLDAEKLVDKTSYRAERVKLYSRLAQTFKELGDYKKVTYYWDKHLQLKDSVFGDQKRNNLMRVNAEFLERENKAKIESQAESIKLQDELIGRQKQIRILILVVAGLMMVLVYILYRINLQRKAANVLLDQMVAERTRELEKSYQELRSAINERDAVAKKIFDEVKSSLVTVGGLCLVGKKDFGSEVAGKYLDDINEASLKIRNSLNSLE